MRYTRPEVQRGPSKVLPNQNENEQNGDHDQDCWVSGALGRSPRRSPSTSFYGVALGHLGDSVIAFLRPSAAKRR